MDKFFIVGCPRSGTTMVQQALNRHSRVVIPPETKYFFAFLGHSHKRQLRHVDRLDADLHLRLPRPTSPVRTVSEGRAFYEIMARKYVRQLGKSGVTAFGEKTPEHTSHLPLIRQHFPDAKILVLYRDGRDVAASLAKMPWASPDLYVNFLVWLYYHRAVQAAKVRDWPGVYFARYEDIVADPEKQLGAIQGFLDLPYESAVATGFGNREGVPQREYGWKGRALQKITPERVGSFRRELTEAQIATLERLGRHALPANGYRLVTDGRGHLSIPFFAKLAVATSKFVCRLPWPLVGKALFGRSLAPEDRGPARPLFDLPKPPRRGALVPAKRSSLVGLSGA